MGYSSPKTSTPLNVYTNGKSPYVDNDGYWMYWDKNTEQWIKGDKAAGESSYAISLSENFASVQADSDGNITVWPTIRTKPFVYLGTQEIGLGEDGLSLNLAYDTEDLNVIKETTGEYTGYYKIEPVKQNNEINDRETVTFALMKNTNVVVATTFEIVKQKSGAPGEYVYVIVDPKTQHFGNFSDITLSIYKRVGDVEPQLLTNEVYYEYIVDDESKTGETFTGTATISKDNFENAQQKVQIVVYNNSTDKTIIDKETIQILKDGQNGEGVWILYHNAVSGNDTLDKPMYKDYDRYSTTQSDGWYQVQTNDSVYMTQKTGKTDEQADIEWGGITRISGTLTNYNDLYNALMDVDKTQSGIYQLDNGYIGVNADLIQTGALRIGGAIEDASKPQIGANFYANMNDNAVYLAGWLVSKDVLVNYADDNIDISKFNPIEHAHGALYGPNTSHEYIDPDGNHTKMVLSAGSNSNSVNEIYASYTEIFDDVEFSPGSTTTYQELTSSTKPTTNLKSVEFFNIEEYEEIYTPTNYSEYQFSLGTIQSETMELAQWINSSINLESDETYSYFQHTETDEEGIPQTYYTISTTRRFYLNNVGDKYLAEEIDLFMKKSGGDYIRLEKYEDGDPTGVEWIKIDYSTPIKKDGNYRYILKNLKVEITQEQWEMMGLEYMTIEEYLKNQLTQMNQEYYYAIALLVKEAIFNSTIEEEDHSISIGSFSLSTELKGQCNLTIQGNNHYITATAISLKLLNPSEYNKSSTKTLSPDDWSVEMIKHSVTDPGNSIYVTAKADCKLNIEANFSCYAPEPQNLRCIIKFQHSSAKYSVTAKIKNTININKSNLPYEFKAEVKNEKFVISGKKKNTFKATKGIAKITVEGRKIALAPATMLLNDGRFFSSSSSLGLLTANKMKLSVLNNSGLDTYWKENKNYIYIKAMEYNFDYSQAIINDVVIDNMIQLLRIQKSDKSVKMCMCSEDAWVNYSGGKDSTNELTLLWAN